MSKFKARDIIKVGPYIYQVFHVGGQHYYVKSFFTGQLSDWQIEAADRFAVRMQASGTRCPKCGDTNVVESMSREPEHVCLHCLYRWKVHTDDAALAELTTRLNEYWHKPYQPTGCDHSWATYTGLFEQWDFCTKCNERKS